MVYFNENNEEIEIVTILVEDHIRKENLTFVGFNIVFEFRCSIVIIRKL